MQNRVVIWQKIRNGLNRVLHPFLKRWAERYFARPRRYRSHGLRLEVLPSVFHPGLFISTGVLLSFLKRHPLKGKTLLELGAGSGLISLYAARQGARVLASDINPVAIDGIRQNAQSNGVEIETRVSDLFEEIGPARFDYILINPPYYPKTPTNDTEMAFFCGENFEYFSRLFAQLPAYGGPETEVWMILSQDCELSRIGEMATAAGLDWVMIHKKWRWGEWNYIFRIG